MSDVAIIGDVGGHWEQLHAALVSLGCDPERGTVPAGLTVVQVGDLVHRGPHSREVVDLVDRFFHESPDSWVQLIGNHEAQYLRDPMFRWHEVLPDRSVRILNQWYEDGWMRFAHCLSTQGQMLRAPGGTRVQVGQGPLLLTHAGLTAGLFTKLGSPRTAHQAAAAIESDGRSRTGSDYSASWAPGEMLGGPASLSAGVLWAAAADELIPSWLSCVASGRALPQFHQAHGHTSPAYRSKSASSWSRPLRSVPSSALHRFMDEPARLTRVIVLPSAMAAPRSLVEGMCIWGTDPGHGTAPALPWQPLILAAQP